MVKTARMWGSPEELECAALHLFHVGQQVRTTGVTLDQTFALWTSLGGPFAGDAEEHAVMRSRLWHDQVETARAQVVMGFVSVWAALDRQPEREPVGRWIEVLLDAPHLAGTPDRLNMTLFSLMGFVARSPNHYVQALNAERFRIGGHELRPLFVVGSPGPSEAALSYGRRFTSWEKVTAGLTAVIGVVEAEKA